MDLSTALIGIGGLILLVGIFTALLGFGYVFLRYPGRLLHWLARYNAWTWKITQTKQPFPFEKELDPEQADQSELTAMFKLIGWWFVFAAFVFVWIVYTGFRR